MKEKANLLDLPAVEGMLPAILTITKDTFPDITEGNIRSKFDGSNRLLLVKTEKGEPAGYQVFKHIVLPGEEPVSLLYQSFVAVAPSFNGKRLAESACMVAIEIEKPDVVSGSTNVPAMYVSTVNLRNSLSAGGEAWALYPQDPTPPAAIVHLGRRIFDAATKKPVDPNTPYPLNDSLVRTRESHVVRKGVHPFFEQQMKLAPNQQLFYMVASPELNRKTLQNSANTAKQ